MTRCCGNGHGRDDQSHSPGVWGAEGWGVPALAGTAIEATGHSLSPPGAGVPPSHFQRVLLSQKRHAGVACGGDEGKEGGTVGGRGGSVNLGPMFPPITAVSPTECA